MANPKVLFNEKYSKSAPHLVEPQSQVRGLDPICGPIQNQVARPKSVCFSEVREAEILKELAATGPFSVGACFLLSGEPVQGGGYMDPP